MNLPLFFARLAIAFDGPVPAAEDFSILNLEPNQSLVVRYESVGCFHHFVHRLQKAK